MGFRLALPEQTMTRIIRRIVYFLLFVIVLFGGLLFFLKNDQVTTFNYITGSIDLPLSLLLLASLFLGVVLGILASLPLLVHLKREKSRLENRVKMAVREVNNLRVLPVKDRD